jgi:hypothetical protein
MTVMPKPPSPWLNSRYADVAIKWISRLNAWAYRLNNGKGLGGTFEMYPTYEDCQSWTHQVIPLVMCEP